MKKGKIPLDIDACDILNIAPVQIALNQRTEPNWEALAFPKEFSTSKFHYTHPRDIKLTPIRYAQARLNLSRSMRTTTTDTIAVLAAQQKVERMLAASTESLSKKCFSHCPTMYSKSLQHPKKKSSPTNGI